jgi:hypothetical protein
LDKIKEKMCFGFSDEEVVDDLGNLCIHGVGVGDSQSEVT